MTNSLDLNPGQGTGVNTDNPQSLANNSSLGGGSGNPQDSASSGSINTSSSVAGIPLGAGSSTVAVIPSDNKTGHHTSIADFLPVAILVVTAVWVTIYLYRAYKKQLKDS